MFLFLCQVLFDVSTERGEQRIETHFGLVATDRIWVLARVVLQRHECLQQVAVLGREAGTVRVLLDLALSVETLSTVASKRENLVIEEESSLSAALIRHDLALCHLIRTTLLHVATHARVATPGSIAHRVRVLLVIKHRRYC